MDYRIEKKDAFRIIGVSEPLENEIEKNFENVPQMWQKAVISGTLTKLTSMIDSEPSGILGVSVCSEPGEWKYYIAVASNNSDQQFEEYMVPAMTWAVFSSQGEMPGSIQQLEKRIVSEWLPTSGYEYVNAPDIEVYLNADPQNAKYEVWIPVVKKEK